MDDSIRAISDAELQARLLDLVRQERENVASIIEHLIEMDRRRLFFDLGYSSLFAYCTGALGYSEPAAGHRIRATRAAGKFPDLLERLREGKIHLEAITTLAPHLTIENQQSLIQQAEGATVQEVRSIVAPLIMEPPPIRDVCRPVKPPDESPIQITALSPEVISPLPHRFAFTGEGELVTVFEKLRGHLRHKFPQGRHGEIFLAACKEMLSRIESQHAPNKEREKTATSHSEKRRRRIPAAVKREVWNRDGGSCAYVAPEGRRCESREALEYDHVIPFADGGRSDLGSNIRLLCRAHNQHLGKKRFGDYRRAR